VPIPLRRISSRAGTLIQPAWHIELQRKWNRYICALAVRWNISHETAGEAVTPDIG